MSISQQVREERRREYMAAPPDRQAQAHQGYYLWLAEAIGLNAAMLPPGHESSTNEHFNDVPLASWDHRHEWVLEYARNSFSGSINGRFAWSLSDSVCCLKAIAARERALAQVRH
jgi:hypothetical protein